MDVSKKTLSTLFEQLGLQNDDVAMDAFIQSHTPLNKEGPIWAEPFWSSSQTSFLKEALEQDADWAEIVDELSTLLHKSKHSVSHDYRINNNQRENMSNLHSLLQHPGVVAATHSGSFHADEVLAAAAQRLVNPALPILRTRDQEQLDAADILFDVGRIYDPATCRFDHHQLTFKEARENGIPYSSFGLVWRELGEALCGSSAAAARVDLWLVQGVDAIDCGVTISKETMPVSVMSISSAIGGFNPGWQDDTSAEARYAAFERAVSMAKTVLENAIRDAKGFEKARDIIAQGTLLEEGQLLVLDQDLPWKEIVLGSPEYKHVLFVVSPDSQAKWHVNTVPDYPGSFNNRKSLPLAWAGLDDEKLDDAVGIKDCIFCHKARFVAGHKTKEGAMEMARLALRE